MQISGNTLARAAGVTAPRGATTSADAVVIEAWRTRTLTDGTKLDLGRTEKEQGFVVRDDGLFPISFKRSGTQVCDDGSRRLANVIDIKNILPHSGGHTHPLGRTGDVSGLPGPEDGRLAAVTDRPAYVISKRGAFAIEQTGGGFEVRQIAGKPLTPAEQGEVGRTVAQWNSNSGGSGVRCTFVAH
ncbi:hypothetical protein [uncultured Sphingomonas sp.]|uniref:hypothetical protein n=1 Tax=uncultured Sphingomonas sp. TaxID=158754 RepID=UPI0035CC53AF